jgi:glycosyltransferase involved in cell wall biosynthesis
MKFTIITSCYRGAQHLPNLYESLKAQHVSGWDFEWILVDDFSNDGDETVSCIKNYAEISPFVVKTIFFGENHYGSRSVPEALKITEGDYVIILDQDDFLSSHAFEVFTQSLKNYSSEKNLAGICGRCVTLDGKLIGTPFPWNEKISNELEIRHIYRIRGELFQCTQREIIKRFYADMKPGYTNGHIWTQIARNYKYLYTNEIVRIYNTVNPESRSNSKVLRNVKNVLESYLYYFNTNVDYLRKDFKACLIMLVHILRFAHHLGINYNNVTKNMPVDIKAMAYAISPIVACLAKYDRKRGYRFYSDFGPKK